jgi:hypothetical protein
MNQFLSRAVGFMNKMVDIIFQQIESEKNYKIRFHENRLDSVHFKWSLFVFTQHQREQTLEIEAENELLELRRLHRVQNMTDCTPVIVLSITRIEKTAEEVMKSLEPTGTRMQEKKGIRYRCYSQESRAFSDIL